MGKTKPSPAAASKRQSRPRQSPAELAPKILEFLPAKRAEVAKALGRKASDGTVRRAFENLAKAGTIEQEGSIWIRCQELPRLAVPEGFDPAASELHARTLEALREQGTWRDHDIDLLNRYVRREEDARKFRRARIQFGDFQQSKSMRVYANPAIDKERDALRDVQGLADALVITPDARRRHGRDSEGDDEDGDEFDL
jgi:phage terminase small subunit